MDIALKQRLIGAAVIVALAVIFVPILLDGSGHKNSQSTDMEIPPPPKFKFDSKIKDGQPAAQPVDEPLVEQEAIIETEKPQEADTSDTSQVAAVTENPAPVSQPEVLPVVPKRDKLDPELSAWAVQVASFAEKDKAVALQKKLIADRYAAFTERVVSKGKTVYRVKVGPEIKKENAEKLKDRLLTEQGLTNSFVTNHP